ncbi:Trk system potassium uptake protein [Nitratireductor basaltis]|uniref:Trk system potassium uptake protein n=2 Tax=Nitratireductor basaltis TaxID=472175 RepID=A0A084UAX0_9HYPH|nr:Trk system potassium uptake protein [Nitratireductor basaltis]
MLVPAAVDIYYGNSDWAVFAISALATGGLAIATAIATHSQRPVLTTRFAFLVVTVLWATLGVVGALPFYAASLKLDFASAVFESVSAITTTGSTVIVGLDHAPPGILMWRSVLQWIGGIGVIALGLFLLPILKVGGFSYLRIESSDIEDKPFSRLNSLSQALLAIYLGLTILCAIAYSAAGMRLFDAVNHAMTTIATGGFSTHDASFGYYDGYAVRWVGTVFMLLAALPFSILIVITLRGRLDAGRDPQIRLFASYVTAFVLVIALERSIRADVPFPEALTAAAFNFVSIISTAGFASEDYTTWGSLAVMLAFLATFVGGCSGSTAGGIKAYRFLIMGRMLQNGFHMLIYPDAVRSLSYGNRVVDAEMQRSVVLFMVSFLAVWAFSSTALAANGLDLVTSLTASLTALTNVGPGLGPVVGPAGNFSSLSDFAKWVLTVTMLLGRLEILAVLVLLTPSFWR